MPFLASLQVSEVVVGRSLSEIYMVMEYVEHDLKQLSESMKQPFSTAEVRAPLESSPARPGCRTMSNLLMPGRLLLWASVLAVLSSGVSHPLSSACMTLSTAKAKARARLLFVMLDGGLECMGPSE